MKKITLHKDKLFFTSDTHFFHKNVVELSNRPFANTDIMNRELINNWNKVVSNEDSIFILGDFAFTSNIEVIRSLLSKLNGIKYLILGNHCLRNRFNRPAIIDMFEGVYQLVEINVIDEDVKEGIQPIVLCHYPMISWNHSYTGTWQLHGHIHSGPYLKKNSIKDCNRDNQYDVGVDNNNFYPISYNQIKQIFNKNKPDGKTKKK
jgi:calcineurin-like phosphoesterase family protein